MIITKTNEERAAERDRRVALLNELMAETNVDAMICHAANAIAYEADVKFMTDLYPNINRMFSYMKRGEVPYALVGRVDTHFHALYKSCLPENQVLLRENQLGAILDFIDSLPGEKPRIGIPNINDIPLSFWNRIKDTKAEFVDITAAFIEKKAPKSAFELSLIQYTCDIAIESFEQIVKFIEPGKTELEIIGMAEGYLRSRGAQELLVLTRSTEPYPFINRPINKQIKDDDVFVYSCEAAGPYGYWSQIIRPIFMSRKSHKDAYDVLEVVKEALEAGRRAFKPGNTIADVAIAIEDVVAKNNCETGVWSGHGMGIDLGDGISIGRSVKMEIKPNMILTMHPSVLKNGNGVLYSDTFVSTEGEAINMTEKYTGSPYYEDLIGMVK